MLILQLKTVPSTLLHIPDLESDSPGVLRPTAGFPFGSVFGCINEKLPDPRDAADFQRGREGAVCRYQFSGDEVRDGYLGRPACVLCSKFSIFFMTHSTSTLQINSSNVILFEAT